MDEMQKLLAVLRDVNEEGEFGGIDKIIPFFLCTLHPRAGERKRPSPFPFGLDDGRKESLSR